MRISHAPVRSPGLNLNHGGFTLLEVILVVALIALVVSITATFSMQAYTLSEEKKEVMRLVEAISDLRDRTVYEMKYSRVARDGEKLILTLAGREFQTFSFEESDRLFLTEGIRFNRYGLTNGGEIILHLSRGYRIVVEGIQGKISLEQL